MEIDLDAYAENLKTIAEWVAPAQLMPVLKADAYGHGALHLARICEGLGVPMVAVATVEEAMQLRRGFVETPILIFGALPESSLVECLNYHITPTICDLKGAQQLHSAARSLGLRAEAHLYLDTGMGRMGRRPEDLDRDIATILELEHLKLVGIYTHYAVSEEEDPQSLSYTSSQHQSLMDFVQRHHLEALTQHLSNSGAILSNDHGHGNLVRPGLMSYGISPRSDGVLPEGLSPILRLCSRPLIVKNMKAGESVGYGRSFKLTEDGSIATLPVGYADGLPRNLGPHLKVHRGGKPYPVVGKVCMDMTMIHLGDDGANEDDEFVLLGEAGPDMQSWSQGSGRIPYEILTGLGARWTRVYRKGGSVVDVVRSGL